MLAPADDAVAAGVAAWGRLRRCSSWEDRRAVAVALRISRDHALQQAGTDKPFGRKYTRTFAAWLTNNQLDGVNKTVRGTAIKIADNLPAIETWRDKLPEAAQLRLNHPDAIWRHFQKTLDTDTACRHAPSRHFVIFPPAFKERARRRITKVLDVYGPDPCKLADALTAALPHVEDIEELLAFQLPRPKGRPPLENRPRSAAMINLETGAPRHKHAAA